MTQHTPTPWKLEAYDWRRRSDSGHPVFFGRISAENIPTQMKSSPNKKKEGFVIQSGSSFGIFGRTEEEAEANAIFIVRACNAHDDLMEAAEEAKEWLGACEIGTHQHAISLKLKAAIEKAGGK